MAQTPPLDAAEPQPPDGSPEPDRRHDSEHLNDFQAGMRSLARLATGKLTLEQILTEVATFAVQAIPGADGAGLTLMEENRSQYSLGEGPCISAVIEQATMRSGSLGGEQRWPRFGPRVGRLGIHSVLSLPLVTPDGVFGAMNVYARAKEAFDERAERLGELFAAPAAIAVQNAQVLEQTKRLAASLQGALSTKALIDQALGIIRSRSGASSDEAFARLRAMSQTRNVKLAVVAESLVEEAVRRAKARHTDL
jgi:transcriptional regulator with GAF, ATPase, and Fis domain